MAGALTGESAAALGADAPQGDGVACAGGGEVADRRSENALPAGRRTLPRASSADSAHLAQRRKGRIAPEPYSGYFLISQGWSVTAPAMAAVYMLLAMGWLNSPDRLGTALAVIAVLIAALARLFIVVERKPRQLLAMRYAAMGLAVALPMGMFGLAVTLCEKAQSNAGMAPVLGALATIGLVAAIVLGNRLPALLAAQLSLWAPLAILSGEPGGVVALATGAAIGLVALLRQAGIDREVEAEQREMRRAQTRAEEILSDYEQTGQGWFWETDRRGLITYVSPTIPEAMGLDPASLLGQSLTELFVLDGQGQDGERTLHFHLNARSSFVDLAVRSSGQGDERWWSINGRPVYDVFSNFLGFRGSGNDLTEKRRSEQHAKRLAHYDSLTGLANRFQMSQTLEKLLIAPNHESRACAVFLIDLDRFKQVNDTMGHPAGDALLKQVAQRLEQVVGELGRVGRLGGDEFQVIMPGRGDRDRLADLAHRVIEGLSQPYSIDGSRVVIGASVGIALSPDDGVTSEAIIRNADLALYAAKDRGRGCYHFYDANLHSDAEERRQLEQDLRDALVHGGLELHYQPVVHTGSEKITGFEALLRWNHPEKGKLSPTKFIPIAEDCGLIASIGEWALRTACHDLAKWPNSVRVAVNVSPLQFANPALPSIVTNALASAQVDPSRLELEITESVFLNDDAGTDAMFAALKRVGVRLALDDFGTGYSSLGYLKKAPFDKIKIDQGFVRGATIAGSRNGAIIASIVSLANALGMETTAEGVETLDELDLVRELGCSHVQGFIYSMPLDLPNACARVSSDLSIVAQGPRSARSVRRTMLRKVALEQGGERYPVTIRNISATGAMIEGLLDVPRGLEVNLELGEGVAVPSLVRWSQYGRTGLEFLETLIFDDAVAVAAARRVAPPAERRPEEMRRAG